MAYHEAVARWEANPRERLACAALDLFAERGYDATTVADIAKRAGLTKSTFFRHFDDKRDVLFGGQDDMITVLTTAVASAPAGQPPLSCVAELLCALGVFFPSEQRSLAIVRSTVVRAHSALRERELLKSAQLMAAIVDALRARDTEDLTARLTARIGILALETGYDRWTADTNETTFNDHVTKALNELVDQAAELGASKPRGVLVRHDPAPDN